METTALQGAFNKVPNYTASVFKKHCLQKAVEIWS